MFNQVHVPGELLAGCPCYGQCSLLELNHFTADGLWMDGSRNRFDGAGSSIQLLVQQSMLFSRQNCNFSSANTCISSTKIGIEYLVVIITSVNFFFLTQHGAPTLLGILILFSYLSCNIVLGWVRKGQILRSGYASLHFSGQRSDGFLKTCIS